MARKISTVRPSGSGSESFYPTALRRGSTRSDLTGRGEAGAQVLIDAAELEQLRAKAAQVDAMLVHQARTAHELRTPLQSVLGYSRLLDQAGELNGAQREALHTIVAAGHHLLDLLDDVVDIESLEADRDHATLVPVDVEGVVEQAHALVQPAAAAAGIVIEIESEVAGRPGPVVLADRSRLLQVLVNLLTNAIKYNQPGGRVTVRWTPSERSLGGPAAVAPRLHLSVTDTGIGIAPDLQARLFTPFDRLGAERTEVEGHGIGLALCRDLLTSMQGAIAADSFPGIGSTFTIDLALTSDRPTAAAAAAGQPPAGVPQAARTLSVLNVEDNRANRELIDEVVGATGDIAVTSTGSGLAAVDLARTARPDVILLDAHLPDASVDQVLHLLKSDRATASIPVVILTADISSALAEHLCRLGAEICLTKPIDLDALIATIRLLALPRAAHASIASVSRDHVLSRTGT